MADRVAPRASGVDPGASRTGILPAALSHAAAIVASAPLATEPYGAAVVSALHYDVDQVLFGFEAQLRAFAYALHRHDRRLALAPLPELFSSPRSLAAIARVPDGRGTASIVHLRFGPMHHARVLKGVHNIMVCADAPRHSPVDGAVHPFGGGRRLPAPFANVFRYAARHDAAADFVLAEAFLDADIAREAFAPDDAAAPVPAYASIAGLHIRSFAEVLRDPDRTSRPADALDWRRALAGDSGARFVMLPWNLANPASLVPDLVRKLSRRASDRDSGWRLVVFPFNATPVSGGMIAGLAAAAHEQAGRRAAVLRGLFVARLRDLRDAHRLRALFPLAWLEEDDAESVWTGRRLARLGIRVGLVGAPSPDIAHDFAVSTDEPLRLAVSDSFGDRAYTRRSLSARQIAALLVRSGGVPGP